MSSQLALLITTAFVVFAFRARAKQETTEANGLFWPTLWYLVVATHPLGVWLMWWGLPVVGGSADPTDGSLIDRMFFAALTVIGLVILSRRRFDWAALLRQNQWLTAFIALMLASILWSAYPFVSFKRFIKVFGSIVMALVVLTTDSPYESLLTVLRRCLYIHVPMSILCTRYFRNIGVSFDWDGASEAWNGIATSKNVLGQVAMLSVLYFVSEVKKNWSERKWRVFPLLYLAMSVYLLKGSSGAVSMTSISVCAFALLIYLRLQSLRSRPDAARAFALQAFIATTGLIALIVTHSIVHFSEDSVFGAIIKTVGRDITLTERTLIWDDVYAATKNPWLGVGFGGFWIGRLENIPWNENMTWVLGQAHSGYVETFLQTGLLGTICLAGVLLTGLPTLIRGLYTEYDYAAFKITLFITIMFVDITESVYLRGDHHLWFLLMVILWVVPKEQVAHVAVAEQEAAAELVPR